jgi:chitin disaccharide deacetylase
VSRSVIFSADDFGLSVAVNEAVEQAHQEGILQSASLMVAGAAAQDAVRRAQRNPGLRIGLHLVVIEGPAVLAQASVPALIDRAGMFPSDQLQLGVKYFFSPVARRQLAAEIRAQFRAFEITGLALDHANAHKHMHLHPTVGAMLIRIGKEFGLRRIRIPAEPPDVLARCGDAASTGDRALYRWSSLLRRQANQAGLATNDHCFGVRWSGHMTKARIARLLQHLPDDESEIYFHPATRRDPILDRFMGNYEHEAEFQTLMDPSIRALRDQVVTA